MTVPESGVPGSASVTLGGVESTVISTPGVVNELPAASVMTASIVCVPLGVEVASQTIVHGVDEAVPTGAPSTRNCTVATPEPLSAALAASVTLVPATVAPAMGVVIDPVGRVLSIRVVRTFDAPVADPSLASALRSYSPSASRLVSKLAEKGALLSTAIVDQFAAPAGLRSNVTWIVSEEVVVESTTVPLEAAPGLSSVTAGGLLSTTNVRPAETVGPFPATSMASRVTVAGPSAIEVESQSRDAGDPLVVPTTVPLILNTIWPTPEAMSAALPVSVTVPPMYARRRAR